MIFPKNVNKKTTALNDSLKDDKINLLRSSKRQPVSNEETRSSDLRVKLINIIEYIYNRGLLNLRPFWQLVLFVTIVIIVEKHIS